MATLPHEIRKVQVGGATVSLNEWGDGPPILLLHGNPDSGIMWNEVAERLAVGRRCVAPDLPGFGQSEVPAGYERSLGGMARFVEEFLSAAGITRPLDLIAHDFGGPFAFAWAVKHADSVRRIVAINTVFFSDYRWHFWARVWRTPIFGELSMLAMNKPLFARQLRRASGRLSQDHIDRTWASITPRMKQEILRLYRARNPRDFNTWEIDFLALTAKKPTLVIWGDKDPFISPDCAERFGAQRVVHLSDIGHWPPVEAPDECAVAVLEFFSEAA